MLIAIREDEAIPASYPAAPAGLSPEAAALDSDFIWARIESHIRFRYTARAVSWIVEGPGEFAPPLSPATVSATEIWNGATWEAASLSPSPLGGYQLPGCGPYRFTASVGGGPVTATANEAYRRLAEYFSGVSLANGVRQETIEGIGSTEFDVNAVAKALVASGAADLLRYYRRTN
ncbi:hypothetical protein LG047_02545 [Methylocystis sp. WRRC1]|uniref:hypothetical protein n=1 Tax=Methylocystis sp. WRRC1 TaxID=1732014 RepID=UPI001D133A52|nr:hypothetical protein [Methylocystis sp. WRRC1]MCC3244211.1 hypothetical protein [Methylocystis sp. WRRC1]